MFKLNSYTALLSKKHFFRLPRHFSSASESRFRSTNSARPLQRPTRELSLRSFSFSCFFFSGEPRSGGLRLNRVFREKNARCWISMNDNGISVSGRCVCEWTERLDLISSSRFLLLLLLGPRRRHISFISRSCVRSLSACCVIFSFFNFSSIASCSLGWRSIDVSQAERRMKSEGAKCRKGTASRFASRGACLAHFFFCCFEQRQSTRCFVCFWQGVKAAVYAKGEHTTCISLTHSQPAPSLACSTLYCSAKLFYVWKEEK